MKIASLSLLLACGALVTAHASAEYRISGPYTHENLSIFLIHGMSGGRSFLTLKEAIDQKKVVVRETKQVNELTVENVSTEPVFIQGGDIVKGGQQDRVISNDFILPSKSGKMPVSAFCVEQGRWTARGSEPVGMFNSASLMIATKELKMAVKAKKDQTEVWREVANTQAALATSVELSGVANRVSVLRAPASPTSLQLTLESRPLTEAVDGYMKALTRAPAGKPDVIEFAFTINGSVNSADIYSSPALFTAMWPKLLRSSAVEAVGSLKKSERLPPATAASIRLFLSEAEGGKQSTVDVDRRVNLVTYTGEKQVLFESRDGSGWIHRNYINK